MKSINFEFLRSDWPELADLAGKAEIAAHETNEAVASLVYQRLLIEQFVKTAYDRFRISVPYRGGLHEMILGQEFRDLTSGALVTGLQFVREMGNQAAHKNQGDRPLALKVLEKTHDAARWFFGSFARDRSQQPPAYQQATAEQLGTLTKAGLKRERKQLLQKAQELEQETFRLKAETDEIRKKLDAERERLQAQVTDQQAELDRLNARQTINALQLDEAGTRKLIIDQYLIEAGWNLEDTKSVRQEMVVDDEGHKADYVLFDREKERPLAVIEAKKAAIDPIIGKEQARQYADALEKRYDFRPVIFYTSGHETWLWDDARGFPPRAVYGFYSKESLDALTALRQHARPDLSGQSIDTEIAGRNYQIRAINAILERFQDRHRKALLVQATGTGKTRVAIALCKAMIDAGWCRRVLFLCDRRELRKQAKENFDTYLSDTQVLSVITAETKGDQTSTIYFATYQTMLDAMYSYDIGYFDLIIADESHRSIYNRYGEILQYFDACQLGLTATPKSLVDSNTYRLFNCKVGEPTFFYSYQEAIEAKPEPFLSTFRVIEYQTGFHRQGIKYEEMTEEQRREVEEQELDPDGIDYDAKHLDRLIFNKDTNRKVLENLMEEGLKDRDGSRIGKTIIFARSHNHAVLLHNLFNEMYPQYGGRFCQVIDNYVERNEELIEDFKGNGKHNDIQIAVSVDMLDTGIDVPEILNLVFAKPVFSFVKFWQMIGRGTRLCKDLFGPGKHKTEFLIFDHWGNFKYFDEKAGKEDAGDSGSKSLQQRLFENRIALAAEAVRSQNTETFELAKTLILENLNALPEKSIAVKSKWKELHFVKQQKVLDGFDATTQKVLNETLAPLMQWISITGAEQAWKFDTLCCMAQLHKLRGSAVFADKRDQLIDWISRLKITLNAVRNRIDTIEKAKSNAFWDNATVGDIEQIRTELRGIAQHADWGTGPSGLGPTIIDITEDTAKIESGEYVTKSFGLDQIAYRKKVEALLQTLVDESTALKKIRSAQSVSEAELKELAALVVAQEPELSLDDLKEYYPNADKVESILFEIVGLDPAVVAEKLDDFVKQHHGGLSGIQMKCLDIIRDFVNRNGKIHLADLYDDPFTTLSPEGIDGVFADEMADELVDLIKRLSP